MRHGRTQYVMGMALCWGMGCQDTRGNPVAPEAGDDVVIVDAVTDGPPEDVAMRDVADVTTPTDAVSRDVTDVAAPSDVTSPLDVATDVPMDGATPLDVETPTDRACGTSDVVCERDLASMDIAMPPDTTTGSTVQRSCASGSSPPGCGMVLVPGGLFTMGEAAGGEAATINAQPEQPSITVDGFWLDTYEVTVGRFRAFWAAGHPSPGDTVAYPASTGGTVAWPTLGSVREPCVRNSGVCPDGTGYTRYCNWTASVADREALPINCVDWPTAQAFCVWDGGRLPTEAEWEFAARGTDGRPLPWGAMQDPSRICSSLSPGPDRWMGGVGAGSCLEEDSAFAGGASPFGALHMIGNIQEWAADWFDDYAAATCWSRPSQRNPLCDHSASRARVLRGGSWSTDTATFLRAGTRRGVEAVIRLDSTGMRCARAR